jgi:hypothetical protein
LGAADQVADHDQPRRDADAGVQRAAGIERGDRRDQLKPAPDRTLGVILMRLRK